MSIAREYNHYCNNSSTTTGVIGTNTTITGATNTGASASASPAVSVADGLSVWLCICGDLNTHITNRDVCSVPSSSNSGSIYHLLTSPDLPPAVLPPPAAMAVSGTVQWVSHQGFSRVDSGCSWRDDTTALQLDHILMRKCVLPNVCPSVNITTASATTCATSALLVTDIQPLPVSAINKEYQYQQQQEEKEKEEGLPNSEEPSDHLPVSCVIHI